MMVNPRCKCYGCTCPYEIGSDHQKLCCYRNKDCRFKIYNKLTDTDWKILETWDIVGRNKNKKRDDGKK
jgi:hypothetical protein